MKCPKCKSENVSIQFVEVGSKTKKTGIGAGGKIHNANRTAMAIMTGGASNLFIKKAKGEEKSKTKNQKVCICQECGHSWKIK